MRDAAGYGIVDDGALGMHDGVIAWVGARRDLPRDVKAANTIDCRARFATPGLVDCHTHLVYAGNRAIDFERRVEVASFA
jgi:imidazolonepropionase